MTAQDYSLGPLLADDHIGFPVLRHIVNDLKPSGYAVEFGVAEGTSLAVIAAHMPAVGFDSFQGLPEDWCEYPKGSRACDVPTVANAEIVVGLFADTLPSFDFDAIAPIGLAHFDADLYSSTKTALDYIGPYIGLGCFVVFDEWHGPRVGVQQHEQRAWREYVQRTGTCWTVVGHDSEAWAIRIEGVR